MAKRISVDELAQAIKDLSARLSTIKAALDITEREFNIVSAVQEQLEENIAVLKTKEIITVAIEYRKAVEDLKKAKHRLAFLRINRETYRRAFREQDSLLKHLKERHEKVLEELKTVVIQGNFGRKKDGG